ncbi:hypothetical protein [Elongatibacter sediminis]|uniref:Uncharacterized protein n=1 Tax=Elongatibacter sediminis TaxID=3119006 RepID=A0AAW9RG43_9GAMM
MSIPRIFAERISAIEPDVNNGNIKLTFAVNGRKGSEDTAQIIMHVNDLRRAFGEVFEVVQRTYFDPKRPATDTSVAGKPLDDLTAD